MHCAGVIMSADIGATERFLQFHRNRVDSSRIINYLCYYKIFMDEEPMHKFASKDWSNRRAFIGGSDARIIMGKDEAALIQLWREKRGAGEAAGPSGHLLLQLGRATQEDHRPSC